MFALVPSVQLCAKVSEDPGVVFEAPRARNGAKFKALEDKLCGKTA